MENDDLRAAALLGAAGGLRTFTPAATLAARGRLKLDGNLRTAIMILAAGELIGDKLPWTPARTAPLPYLGRVIGGAVCGSVVAGRRGSLAGAGAAAITTTLGYQCRRLASQRWPGTLVALIEDAVAVGAANLGVPNRR